MDIFEYQQIDLESSAFRLVRLLKADRYKDVVECELIYTTLDENVVPYEAVSYTWGTSLKACRIKVQGLDFMVTSNLWDLLRDLRQADTDRYLWIDAISINQDDDLERGHQVRRMQSIYSGAERVLCYLGETTESISILMSSLAVFQRHASGYRWESGDSRWRPIWERAQIELQIRYGNETRYGPIQEQGLQELLTRPWFRRVWVLQEVASARKASLYCGRNSIPVPIFVTSTSLLGVDLDSHSRAVLKLMPTYSRNALRKTEDRSLYQILADFRQSEASEPHDKIFALLGLCADPYVWEAVVPDYTQTESALVCATITYITTRSLGSRPEWLSLARPPPISIFLSDLSNAINHKHPMNTRHIEGLISANVHITDAATLDRPIAFEMMSLALKYDNGLNDRPIRNDIPNMDYHGLKKPVMQGHSLYILRNMDSHDWKKLGMKKHSLYILIYGHLLNRLYSIMQLSDHYPTHPAVLDRRKEVYRFICLTSGPYLNDVTKQRSLETTEIFGRDLWPYESKVDALEQTILKKLTESDRYKADGFEEWALFTMAVMYGRMWTEQGLLVRKPAGFDQCGMSDSLALYSAIYFQHAIATWRLLDTGVKIVIGKLPNPLSLAVHHGNRAIMDVLRAYSMNIVGYDGRFPLHCAAELETTPVIRFLLEQGADPDAVDIDGRTALQVARDSGRPGVVRLLEAVRDGTLNDLDVEAAEAVEVTVAMNGMANWVGGVQEENEVFEYFYHDS
ncbi:heterokaryon incompatibility protein-domain-containing protein [Xylaria curta]|nr:heterokaryon incompatibility protein-domain-containing protein [Xylaria curta]